MKKIKNMNNGMRAIWIMSYGLILWLGGKIYKDNPTYKHTVANYKAVIEHNQIVLCNNTRMEAIKDRGTMLKCPHCGPRIEAGKRPGWVFPPEYMRSLEQHYYDAGLLSGVRDWNAGHNDEWKRIIYR